MKIWDTAIIGAGMSGLSSARMLRDLGYSVVVVEKSRGVGGRVATRRISDSIRVDHGACYFKPKGEVGQRFLKTLITQDVLHGWEGEYWQTNHVGAEIYKSPFNHQYIAKTGMSAIAKFLATSLEILFQKRAISLSINNGNWQIFLEDDDTITAKSLVIAIPAPQATILLKTIPPSLIDPSLLELVNSIEYHPCLSLMAGYSASSSPLPVWNAFTFLADEVLGWIGFDSSKRHQPEQPCFCIQTSPKFAHTYLDTDDLQTAIPLILNQSVQATQLYWLQTPEWTQIHRWRYAFPTQHICDTCLATSSPAPLVLCGDWCHPSTESLIENAIYSGIATTQAINRQLFDYPIPDDYFLPEEN